MPYDANQKELNDCFNLLKKYEPFTIATFVELEKNNNFKNIHDDLLAIQTIINLALAKKIK